MKKRIAKYARGIASQMSIILVLFDLHFEGVEGVNKAESQKHLTIGNQLLHAGQLAEALTQYHASIDNDPRNYQAYYMRATVYLAMGKARTALPDLEQVINLQPNFIKARLQRGNLYLKMGRFNDAQIDYEAVLSQQENADATAKVEVIRPMRRNINQASRMLQTKDYHHVVNLMKEVIETCPWNAEFREMRAMAHEGLGDLRSAISDLKPTTTLKLDNTAGHLRISILYYNIGEVEQSLEEIRECLKLDPDHKECYAHYKSVKKLFKTVESGKNFMKESRWDDAIAKFNKALQQESRIFAFNLELKLKICECSVKKASPIEAIASCQAVLKYDEKNIPALILMSEAHTLNSQYEEAINVLQQALEIDQHYPGLDDKIKQANKMLKQSQKRDYYKILGVSRNARKKDIEKAYRKMAREWHPDNFKSEEEKKVAEQKFIDLAAAKEVLTDPDKLRIYLAGYDPLDREDVEEWEKGESAEDANKIFKFFFHSETKESGKKPIDNIFKMFNRRSGNEDEDDEEDEEFLRESRRRKQEKKRNEERERLIREDERRKIQEELRKREEEENRRKMEEERRRKEEEQKRLQEEMKRKKEEEEEKRRLFEIQRKQEEKKRKYFEEQDRRIQEEKIRLLQERRAQEERIRILQNQQGQKRSFQSGFRMNEEGDNQRFHAGREDPVFDTGDQTGSKKSTKKKKTKKTTDKKTKKSKKKKKTKTSSKNDQTSPRFTKGTDGKWYEKTRDGKWVLSQGPGATDNEESDDMNEQKTFTTDNGDVYVQADDGSWYKRVQPPPVTQTDDSRSSTSGVYKDNFGRIVDKNGNVYRQKIDGTLEVIGNIRGTDSRSDGRSRMNEDLRNNPRAGQNQGVFGDPNKSYFRDKNGVPYYIDDSGNFMRVKSPGEQDKRRREDTANQFSYRDDSTAKAKERWSRQSSQQHQQGQWHRVDPSDSGYKSASQKSTQGHRSTDDLRAEIMRQQEMIAKRLMDAQLGQNRGQYYEEKKEKRQKFDNGQDPLDPEEQQNGFHRGHGFNPFGGGGFKFHFGGNPFHDEF